MKKMKTLLEDIALSSEPKVNKFEVIEGVSNYGMLGTKLYNENNLVDIAENLIKIAESAHDHILSETDDWFDKVSINRNMKSLNNMVKEFKKTAIESNQLNQRLTSLYEDMGHVLNRYYDIREEEQEFDQRGHVEEELKSSDIGKSENSLSKDAAKADEKLNKDEKYKYNEQKNSVFSMPSLVSLAPSPVTKVKK
tara:strand:- start:6150 stop:6734 length:585 start_codon:yes stop_codon:yes gene_type:complete